MYRYDYIYIHIIHNHRPTWVLNTKLKFKQAGVPGSLIHTYCSPIRWFSQISAAACSRNRMAATAKSHTPRVNIKHDRPKHQHGTRQNYVVAAYEFHVIIQRWAANVESHPGCWAHPAQTRLCLKLFKLHIALSSGEKCQDPPMNTKKHVEKIGHFHSPNRNKKNWFLTPF